MADRPNEYCLKVLITGGSGFIGRAFIKNYRSIFQFMAVGRDENKLASLKADFPEVETRVCSIESKYELFKIYDLFRPDTVIHLAAAKHVDLVESQPLNGIKINVIGSLNVIEASKEFKTEFTIAASTDKACQPSNIYGMTKLFMERMFLEANTENIKFAVCRFGNVAGSTGSVIPFWKDRARKGVPLMLTNVRMNRFFFTATEAVELLYKALNTCIFGKGGFIFVKKMKCVNMLDLAKVISENIIITAPRPGETLETGLISDDELPFTIEFVNHIRIHSEINSIMATRLKKSYNTENALRMNTEEIKKLLEDGL